MMRKKKTKFEAPCHYNDADPSASKNPNPLNDPKVIGGTS